MRQETSYNSVSAGSYSYDGDGRRVKRIVGTIETWQVFGMGGELLAEYAANTAAASPQKEYGYRNGQLLITATVTVGSGGSAFSFADDPLVAGTTNVKAVHLTELRTAVNQARAHAGLAAASWAEGITAGTTTIKASHITELRARLDEARSALGLAAASYTDPTLTAGTTTIKAAHVQELRIKSNEAITAGGSGGMDLRWLVTDQLGTPRMVFDQNGSLANTSRHDYLPFGEELFANTAGRTTALGYTNADGARQKFTLKERDIETGLDYFLARYYSSTQGRFTGVDPYNPITQSKNANQFNLYLLRPQNWNRYVYVLDNPLGYVDPDGEKVYVVLYTTGNTRGGDDEFKEIAETVKKGIEARKDFDPKKDKVVFAGVSTKEEFKAALRAANDLEEGGFGKISNLVLVSHGGPNSGPVFRRGGETEAEQQFADPNELSRGNMLINWEKGALATFLTCDSAQNFTRNFSEEQGVVSEGFPGGTTFSSDPGSKSHSYVWSGKGGLYLIRQNPGPGGDVGPATYVPEKNKEFVQKFVPKH
jgi:RHS repeat-associated protein